MAELSARDLFAEWRKLMDSARSSAVSLGGDAELSQRLLEPMQRQLELIHELLEREHRLQQQMAGRVLAPVEAVLELAEESGNMLRRQARPSRPRVVPSRRPDGSLALRPPCLTVPSPRCARPPTWPRPRWEFSDRSPHETTVRDPTTTMGLRPAPHAEGEPVRPQPRVPETRQLVTARRRTEAPRPGRAGARLAALQTVLPR